MSLKVAVSRPEREEGLQGEVLLWEQFRKQLHVEKRRADRTGSPLSIVSIRIAHAERAADVDRLLDQLSRGKRETDILGEVAEDHVALLLPHTDKQGAQVFANTLLKNADRLDLSVAFATYPDRLFEKIVGGQPSTQDSLNGLFDERTEVSYVAATLKRTLDVLGSIAGIILLAPIMLITAALVAGTSPGPVIFRQTRIGKGGVPFVFYKFRSMKVDADDRIHREYVANLIDGNLSKVNQGDRSRPVYKMKADPRITRVGQFIRKTSIDELPQLFNVLKGDMSLVGPRPPLPYEAEKYQSWHLRRVLQGRPGITGLWQVEGRSTIPFDEMVRLDLRYIRSQSLWLDLKILFKTVKVVLRRDGAS